MCEYIYKMKYPSYLWRRNSGNFDGMEYYLWQGRICARWEITLESEVTNLLLVLLDKNRPWVEFCMATCRNCECINKFQLTMGNFEITT
jgi:hypothetical protein